MSDFALELYRMMFTSLKRGNYRGVISNAKPIYLISLIDAIPEIGTNQIYIDLVGLLECYRSISEKFNSQKPTPIITPFFHLNTEPFYTLVWKGNVIPPSNSHTPSAKFLREHLEYAKLDDELWELLQDADNREYLKQAIIKQYLSTDKI